jgi:D-aminoacyl-tRNA deacylase
MSGKVTVICSAVDLASMNIARCLQELKSWKDEDGYKTCEGLTLLTVEGEIINERGLEERIASLGLKPTLLVFASRHKSKEEVPWMGGHFTGSIGANFELAAAAPLGLKSFLKNLAIGAPEGYSISAEATHHGPTDLSTPSFFAEIGSTESQWSDPTAGMAVARSILDMKPEKSPVFLGFGGGHYVSRQTGLILETDIAFGHLFSSYQIEALDAVQIAQARDRSEATYAYLDKKSLRSEGKKLISRILNEIDLPQMKEGEIRASFPSAYTAQI